MARSRSIGNVYAELSVKDKMTAGMKKAGKSVDSLSQKLAGIGKAMAFAAPAAAVGAVTLSMKSAIDAGGELADMMTRTSADGEQLFIIGQAFKNAGLEASGVGDAVNRMQKQLAAGGEGFAKIGLEVGDLRKMDPAAAFRSIAESISKIEDPAERTAAAMEIFGKSGGKMLAVLNDPAAFSQAEEQVGGLGKTLADNSAALDSFGDSLGALKLNTQELGAGVAVALLPELQKLVNMFENLDVAAAGSGIGEMAVELAHLAKAFTEIPGISHLGKAFGEGIVSPDVGPTEQAKAAAMAASWAAADPRNMQEAVDPFALPPGAEAARQAELRMSAPFVSGDKDKAILDELRKQTGIMKDSKANGTLTW